MNDLELLAIKVGRPVVMSVEDMVKACSSDAENLGVRPGMRMEIVEYFCKNAYVIKEKIPNL